MCHQGAQEAGQAGSMAESTDAAASAPATAPAESLEQHVALSMRHLMRSVAEDSQQRLLDRLEASEAKNVALELRLKAVEKQAAAAEAAAQEKSQNKFGHMAPALIAMMGDKKKGGGGSAEMSDDDKAMLHAVGGLGEEMAQLRATVERQSALLDEVQGDLHFIADAVFDPSPEDAEGGGAPAAALGGVAVPPGYEEMYGSKGVVVPTSSGGQAAISSGAPSTAGDGQPSVGRRAVRLRGVAKVARLVAQVSAFQIEVEGALAAAGLGGKGGGMLSERLSDIEKNVLAEVRTLAGENRVLRASLEELSTSHKATAADLGTTKATAIAAAEQAAATAAMAVDTAAMDAVRAQLVALEEGKATRFEFDAIGDAVREVRAAALSGGSGGGSDTELLATLQAAQQSTQGHVLSLQTHLRALLRKAEQEKSAEVPAVDMTVIDQLRQQVHEALHELQTQLTTLSESKADAEKVDRALEGKAERRLMTQKADRAFCEALLARFAVEVGRQLGDMEQNQLTIKGSLEEAVVRLMNSSAENAASPLKESNDAGDGAMSFHADGAPGSEAPFSVRQLRARSAGTSRTRSSASAKGARGGRTSPGFDHDLPPMGMGQLAVSVFVTGEKEAQGPDPQRYAFQPRRPAGMMTPGEQTLVRQRPRTAAGRLTGSASSAGLLTIAPPR